LLILGNHNCESIIANSRYSEIPSVIKVEEIKNFFDYTGDILRN
jgi:hypothetical protein